MANSQQHCKAIQDKFKNKKFQTRIEIEHSKIICDKLMGLKLLNIFYLPKSRLFEVLVMFDQSLNMIFNVEEETFTITKIKCLLEDS